MDVYGDGALAWNPPDWREIIRWSLPHKGLGDRLMIKTVALIIMRQVRAVRGLEHVSSESDPFILVANHSTRRESIVMPTLLLLHRGGRPVHFLADWNFMVIPGVRRMYRCGGAITVPRKSARPRFLNVFKSLFVETMAPNDRARQHLAAGRSVGAFPEGTVNRNPDRLLAGRNGAARLSLETGIPIVPMGIRFAHTEPGQPVAGPMEIDIGPPRFPPAIDTDQAPLAVVRDWHATVMSDIGRLSGKNWTAERGGRR